MHFVKPSQSEISLTKTYFFNSGIFARCCTFIAVAAIFSPLAITTGVAGDAATMPSVENGGTLPYQRADLPVEERVKDLVGRMTFEEKARLHVQLAATKWGGLPMLQTVSLQGANQTIRWSTIAEWQKGSQSGGLQLKNSS
jgi:hypothetical protein